MILNGNPVRNGEADYMKKVLRVLKKIVLLAYLIFFVLCTHSLIMRFGSTLNGDTPAEAVPTEPPAAAAPTPPPANENDVALSSGTYAKDAESLTAVVVPSDLPLLDSFSALRASNC